MEWTPLHQPKPEDGKSYDIRLKNGTVINNVVYWDYGAGFEPLELDEKPSKVNRHVKYPIEEVVSYRKASG